MLETDAEIKHQPTLQEFYDGKSVFVTGATGFVGSVLLENLLRSCTGIKTIYVLLRSKKNVQPEERKEEILNKKIFEKMKEETPEVFRKIHVIPGDAALPNLGMCTKDIQILLEEVSIVFHCAAIVSFTKPLMFMLLNNVLSLNRVVELCRKLKKLEALVYTSTAYSNCNHLSTLIKEEVYRLPFHADKFLDALKNEDIEKLQELISQCKPDWPNAYTFSKCLAENVIVDTAFDLPVVIIRPSIVVVTWKHPIPGYIEENSGTTALAVGVGKGFVKVLHVDPNSKLNFVPVDIVSNTHVIAAWSVGTKRCVSPMVVNCTASENLHVKISEYIETLSELGFNVPMPKSFDRQSVLFVTPSKYLFNIVAAYKHYLPAIVLDGMLKVLGKKPKVFSKYRFFDKAMSILECFMFNIFQFERKNMEYLDKLIDYEDRKNLCLDFKDANLLELSQQIPNASPFYDWKIDRRSQSERQKIKDRRHWLICFIQGMFLMSCCLFIYKVFSFIFR